MTIEVWAPRAARVRLRLAGLPDGAADIEMTPRDAGWWTTLATPDPAKNTDSCSTTATFAPTRARAASRGGVHDLSAWDDAASFVWSDAAWTGRQLAGG